MLINVGVLLFRIIHLSLYDRNVDLCHYVSVFLFHTICPFKDPYGVFLRVA